MQGTLVRLRRYERSDLDELMRYVNDEEVTRNLGSILTLPVSRLAEEGFLESVSRGSQNDHEFAIETLAGEYLGGCGLHSIDWIDRNAEAGIVIWKKEYWAKGYGTNAMMVLLR